VYIPGPVIYGVLLLAALARLVVHSRHSKRFSARCILHIFVVLYAGLELAYSVTLFLYYTDDGHNHFYGFHVFSYMFFFLALTSALRMWALEFVNQVQRTEHSIEVAYYSVNVAFALFEVYWLTSLYTYPSFRAFNMGLPYKTFDWGLVVYFLSVTIGFSAFAWHAQRVMGGQLAFPGMRQKLRRVHCTMALLAFCFILRATVQIVNIYDQSIFANNAEYVTILWYLLSNWIPNVVPMSVLLVLMRRPDASPEELQSIGEYQYAVGLGGSHGQRTSTVVNSAVAGAWKALGNDTGASLLTASP
jgi:hypothetical protein